MEPSINDFIDGNGHSDPAQINDNFLKVMCHFHTLFDVLGFTDETTKAFYQRSAVKYTEALKKLEKYRDNNR
jgi:hypothetical protein